MSQMSSQKASSFLDRFAFLGGLVAVVSLVGGVGCSSDQPGQKSCASHSDCEVGQVCGADESCVVEANCEFCEGSDELVCLETDEHPDGVCSTPECETAADCETAGEICTQDGRCAEAECADDSDCPDGEICNVVDQCAPASDTGVPEDAGLEDVGGDDAGPAPDDGGPTADGTGGDSGGDGGSCMEGGPEDCSSEEHWSSDLCTCVECLDDEHCEGDKECRDGSCRVACTQSCQGSGGDNNCPEDKPYCIAECCVECIGSTDCPDGQLCVDDECTESETDGDCSEGECPTGYACNTDSGQCEPEQSGEECSQSDPSCPSGETCNFQSNQCEPVQGGQNCGGCNSGCTCPGSSTCDTQLFMCTGCEYSITGSSGCPSGQTCFPASFFSTDLPNVCM